MEKKPYVPPKIFQVELNQEQAILTSCSVGESSISNKIAPRYCNSNTAQHCRRYVSNAGTGGTTSAAAPS